MDLTQPNLVALACLALVLAACGRKTEAPASSPPGPDAAQQPAPAPGDEAPAMDATGAPAPAADRAAEATITAEDES